MSESKSRTEKEVRELRAELKMLTTRYVLALAGDEDARALLFDSAAAAAERERCIKACEDSAKIAEKQIHSRATQLQNIRAQTVADTCNALARSMRKLPIAKDVAA